MYILRECDRIKDMLDKEKERRLHSALIGVGIVPVKSVSGVGLERLSDPSITPFQKQLILTREFGTPLDLTIAQESIQSVARDVGNILSILGVLSVPVMMFVNPIYAAIAGGVALGGAALASLAIKAEDDNPSKIIPYKVVQLGISSIIELSNDLVGYTKLPPSPKTKAELKTAWEHMDRLGKYSDDLDNKLRSLTRGDYELVPFKDSGWSVENFKQALKDYETNYTKSAHILMPVKDFTKKVSDSYDEAEKYEIGDDEASDIIIDRMDYGLRLLKNLRMSASSIDQVVVISKSNLEKVARHFKVEK